VRGLKGPVNLSPNMKMLAVDRAKEGGDQPSCSLHGLWLLPSSWGPLLGQRCARRRLHRSDAGWPAIPRRLRRGQTRSRSHWRTRPSVSWDHFDQIVRGVNRKPAIMATPCGMLAQILAGAGSRSENGGDAFLHRSAACICSLPLSDAQVGVPVLNNPANRNREIPLTYEQLRFGFANAVSEVRPQGTV